MVGVLYELIQYYSFPLLLIYCINKVTTVLEVERKSICAACCRFTCLIFVFLVG